MAESMSQRFRSVSDLNEASNSAVQRFTTRFESHVVGKKEEGASFLSVLTARGRTKSEIQAAGQIRELLAQHWVAAPANMQGEGDQIQSYCFRLELLPIWQSARIWITYRFRRKQIRACSSVSRQHQQL